MVGELQTSDRLDQIAHLLALGYLRWRKKSCESSALAEKGVDFVYDLIVCAAANHPNGKSR